MDVNAVSPRTRHEGGLPAELTDALRIARRSRGWSFRTAGGRLGVDGGHLCAIEHGRRIPSIVIARLLIDGYRLDDRHASWLESLALHGVGRDSPYRAH